MKRKLKKFLAKNIVFIICFIIIICFFFMANGYSILTSKSNINGKTTVTDEDLWNPELSFQMAKRIGNVFFYNIIVYNNSKFAYKDWQMKLYNADYILYTDMLERRKAELWLEDTK